MTDHIQLAKDGKSLLLLDQRLLPSKEEYFACTNTETTIYALQTMVVRGAPAIGVTAAYGCWLAAREVAAETGGKAQWKNKLTALLGSLEAARPTAVNLRWAVCLMRDAWSPDYDLEALTGKWLAMAKEIHRQDIAINKAMGAFGAVCIDHGDTIMTHCNAGALATAGYGTALGVIRAAHEQGKNIKVIANETRPFLQGARLTAYELARDGIPVTVACDNAAALLMKRGLVQKVVVGADRIAANGDAANKIGTFGVALLAKHFGVPFYVAAPSSTFDLATETGEGIPIEERTALEVTHVGATQITPVGVPVYNFAFDVTPAELISGIVTEKGVLRAPYTDNIAKIIGGE